MKTRGAKSKRMSSNQRHKIERKKREHKRDLRKAAKAMKGAGLGPSRSKKTRETARLALKISNAHPDKEQILTQILKARESAKVVRSGKRAQKKEDELQGGDVEAPVVPQVASNKKNMLFIPNSRSNDFTFQFNKALEEIVYPIDEDDLDEEEKANKLHAEAPCSTYLVTVDARCAVQSAPWTLIDAIVERGAEYAAKNAVAAAPVSSSPQQGKKRGREEAQPVEEESLKPQKHVLILFALTKADLVSAETISTQFALLAHAVHKRYFGNQTSSSKKKVAITSDSLELPGGIHFSITPVSTQFDRCQKHVLKILRLFATKYMVKVKKGNQAMAHNLVDKVCAFVIGLPGTGRRTLSRCLLTTGTDSAVAVVPLRAAQVQLVKSKDESRVDVRFVLPNAKNVTLVQFAEDVRHRTASSSAVAGGDIIFQSYSFLEKIGDPETIAVMVANSAVNKVGLAQAFCQAYSAGASATDGPAATDEHMCDVAAKFLKGIGHTVRREGGFHVSPLFVAGAGSLGQISANSLTASTNFTSGQSSNASTLLDATYSNARPSKLVRVGLVNTEHMKGRKQAKQTRNGIKRADGHNALRIGARTFLREFVQSKNVPWAILRANNEVLTPQIVADASRVFSLALFTNKEDGKEYANSSEYFATYLSHITSLLKDVLVLLPNGVVEFAPDSVVPVLHDLEEPVVEESEEESDEEEDEEESDEEEDEEEGDDDEESGSEGEAPEGDDEELEGDFEESDDDEDDDDDE